MSKATDSPFWLLDDADALYHAGRRSSAILLLVCAVDALARHRDKKKRASGKCFEDFLRSKLRRPGRPQIHSLGLPGREDPVSFERVLYKFLRCPLVHEGDEFGSKRTSDFSVVLDWKDTPYGLRMDSRSNCVFLGGEFAFGILRDAITHEISTTKTRECGKAEA